MAAHDQSKKKALETIRRLARPFPRGFKFRREEANERYSALRYDSRDPSPTRAAENSS
jgi:hypothetical protein